MKYIITGGGTGGHIFSAIATANALKKIDTEADFLFVGAQDYMEMSIVPKTGYEIVGMNLHRIKRKNFFKNIKIFYEIVIALWQSYKLLKKYRPDAVIGTGGFATGPIIFAAQYMGIPTFVQEHNSYPGLTNRLLAKKATRIHTAYKSIEQYLNPDKILLTGNPIRDDFYQPVPDKKMARQFYKLAPEKFTVLIMGGSDGAAPINDAAIGLIDKIKKYNMQILLQTGKVLYDKYKNYQTGFVKILPFIDNMMMAYAAVDVVVARAGAMSTTELALLGKPAIIVPAPNLEQDHQTKNALELSNVNAAVFIPEKKLQNHLWPELKKLIDNPEKLITLSQNIKQFAFPDAAKDIATDIFEYLKKQKV